MPAAAAIPIASAVAGPVASWLTQRGSKGGQGTAGSGGTQVSAPQVPGITFNPQVDTSTTAGLSAEMLDLAKSQYGDMSKLFAPAINYYTGMAAGGPQAVEAAAPDLATLAGNMKQARESAMLGPRGVGMDTSLAMLPGQAAGAAAGMIAAGRQSAFPALTQMGQFYGQLGESTNRLGMDTWNQYMNQSQQGWRDLVNAQLGQRQQDISQRGQDIGIGQFNAQTAAQRNTANQGLLGGIIGLAGNVLPGLLGGGSSGRSGLPNLGLSSGSGSDWWRAVPGGQGF